MSRITVPPTSLVRFRHAKGVVSTRQCDTTVLLDVNAGLYYTLNEVGGRIWDLLGQGKSIERRSSNISKREHEVSVDVLRGDVEALVERLFNSQLISAGQ